MCFRREKSDSSNQNRERYYFTCDKNDTSDQKPQRCVSFGPKFPPLQALVACNLQRPRFKFPICLADIQREKSTKQSFSLSFSRKKVKLVNWSWTVS